MGEQELRQAIEKEKREVLVNERKKKIEETSNQFIQKAAEAQMQYGIDDYRTQMMLSFVDMSIKIKEIINLLEEYCLISTYLFDALGIIDDIFRTQDEMISESLMENYGFFARWKRNRRFKKAIKNGYKRMNAIADRILAIGNFSTKITESIQRCGLKISTKMAKNNQKMVKKQEKRNVRNKKKGIAIVSPYAEAQKLVDEEIARKGGTTSTTGTDTTVKKEDKPSSGDGDTGVDDL